MLFVKTVGCLKEMFLVSRSSPRRIEVRLYSLPTTSHPLNDLGVSPQATHLLKMSAYCLTGRVLPRKEVIQPHLPVQLPCYDFVPVTSPTLGACLPCGLAQRLQVLPASMT